MRRVFDGGGAAGAVVVKLPHAVRHLLKMSYKAGNSDTVCPSRCVRSVSTIISVVCLVCGRRLCTHSPSLCLIPRIIHYYNSFYIRLWLKTFV